jgi:hypothetical protein
MKARPAVLSRSTLNSHSSAVLRTALAVTALLVSVKSVTVKRLAQIEAEAKARIDEARHRKMALSKPAKPIHAHKAIAKEARVSQHKARQAIAVSGRLAYDTAIDNDRFAAL